jgi:hypothetical protein
MNHTQHAQVRCQQRGIPPVICEWLFEYGSQMESHGATKRFFDHEARKRLAAAVGPQVVDRLGSLLNVYLVESDERVITAGHRTRRIKRR